MFDFNANEFYEKLDTYFAGYDNDATEAFLKGELEKIENEGMILGITSSCPSCNAGPVTSLSDNEKDLIIKISQAKIVVLNETACFYRGISRFEDCMLTFGELLAEMQFSGLDETEQYAVAQINMAGAYRLMGKFEESLALFAEAKEKLTSLNSDNDYDWASLYNNTGLVYQDQNKLPEAVEYFEKALEYTRKVEDNEAELATALSNLSLAYYRVKDIDKADKAITESLSIFEKLDAGMNPHYAGALNTKALFAYMNGDFKASAENFKLAAEKTKMIFGENKDYVACCKNASAAFEKAGDAAEAKKFADIAAAIKL